jgi:hypothetical protein
MTYLFCTGQFSYKDRSVTHYGFHALHAIRISMGSRPLCHNKNGKISFQGAEKRKRLYMQEMDHQSLLMLFVEEVLPFKE